MRAFEFTAHPTENGSIQLPPGIVSQVNPDVGVKVIVLLPEDDEQAWIKFGMDQFAKGYSPEDNIYDDLRAG
jgi:hypothetical protein